MRLSRKKGFTLIELLMVIAIIGILTAIVLSLLNSARLKARDIRRKSDFHQITLALEYYYDKYGGYPAVGTLSATDDLNYVNSNTAYDANAIISWSNLLTPLVDEGFMPAVPRDPINKPSGYFPFNGNHDSKNAVYHFRSNGTFGENDANHYLLCGWLENENDNANLGNNDMLDPFTGTSYLEADLGYSIYSYCVGK